MTWRTELQKNIFNAGQEIQGAVSSTKDLFSNITSKGAAMVGSALQGSDVVGINANQVPAMREAIRTYVAGLESHLENVKVNTDTQNAYKGEYSAAIKEYVAAITEACKAVTSQLLAFSDQLKQIEDAYNSQDTELASKIGASKSSVESSQTRYNEQY